ncbi:GLPGLI family protein [Myroides indicus]|uniref:GLPGLI family protein n=1 Tax=Myroides indicus TaxID=1323422 RepID=A0A4R7EQR6_9FLAO|nr:GLPGLI family protein [Myroides indicus]TDS54602.1 GLPGLI family protein [Myroides indicus]
MKKIFIILAVMCFTVISYAQEFQNVMRYEYQLTYKPFEKIEGIEPAEITEKIFLDVLDTQSRFMPEYLLIDIEAEIKDEEADVPESQFKWLAVFKENKNMTTVEKLNSLQIYAVKQDVNLIKWNILPEQGDYNGLKVQKAEAEFGGRHWTVWFTQEISLIDGPYKFKNLPGFVVKAVDSDKDYLFEFLKSEKASTFLLTEFPQAEEVTDKQLKRIKEANANKNLLQIIEERGSRWANPTEDVKVREHMTKKIGKEPNPIELY